MKQRLVHTIAQEHVPGLTEIVKLEGRFATINKVITELLGPAIADRLATLRAATSTPANSKSTTLATPTTGLPDAPIASNPFPT